MAVGKLGSPKSAAQTGEEPKVEDLQKQLEVKTEIFSPSLRQTELCHRNEKKHLPVIEIGEPYRSSLKNMFIDDLLAL